MTRVFLNALTHSERVSPGPQAKNLVVSMILMSLRRDRIRASEQRVLPCAVVKRARRHATVRLAALAHVAEPAYPGDVLGDGGIAAVLDLSRPTDMRIQTLDDIDRDLRGP